VQQLFVACLSFGLCFGLHEDQAGVNDWFRQHIGSPALVEYSNDGNIAYSLSHETNSLSAVSADTGEFRWRRFIGISDSTRSNDLQFESLQVLDKAFRHVSKAVASVITVHTLKIDLGTKVQTVSAWDGADGALVWDAEVDPDAGTFSKSIFFAVGKAAPNKIKANRVVAVLTSKQLILFSGSSGKRLWRWQADESKTGSEVVWTDMWVEYTNEETIIRVIGKGENNLFVAALSVSDMKPISILLVENAGKPKGSPIHLRSGKRELAGFVNVNNSLTLYDVEKSAVYNHPLPKTLSDLMTANEDFNLKNVAFNSGASSYFTITSENDNTGECSQSTNAYFEVANNGKTVNSLSENFAAAAVTSFRLSPKKEQNGRSGTQYLVGVIQDCTKLEVKQLSVLGHMKSTLEVPDKENRGMIAAVFTVETQEAIRVLVKFDDGSIICVKVEPNEEALVEWEREEALAAVVGIPVSVEMPILSANDTSTNELLDLFNEGNSAALVAARLYSQALGALDTLKGLGENVWNLAKLVVETKGQWLVKAYRGELGASGYTDFEKSNFGFMHVIIMLTSHGKIFALESETGDILWTHYDPSLSNAKAKLFVTRPRVSGTLQPEVLVLSNTGESASYNGLTGALVSKESVPANGRIIEMMPVSFLQKEDEHMERAVVLVLVDDLSVHIVPKNLQSAFATAEVTTGKLTDQLRVFTVDPEQERIVGYGIISMGADLKATELWSMTVPNTYTIVAVGTHPNDPVNSPARHVGGGSVMIKHINPHLAAVAAVSEESATLLVSLIDTVTGKVVERFVHKNCVGPVNIVHFENNVIYTASHVTYQRTEVFAVSIYEGTVLEKYEMNLWTGVPETVGADDSASSFEVKTEKLIVSQRGFFMPHRVRTLAVSKTRQGITERAVLAGLETGGVVSIDRRFLDPRRPIGTPTKQEAEEGLIAYFGEIPVIPQKIITYLNEVQNIDTILTIPTNLESTCLVLIVGIDMFYARLQPSLGFDLLAEEFNYALLIMLTLGLCIGVWFMSRALRQKRLAKKWK